MSDPFDDRLRARLERLSAAIPVEPHPATQAARPGTRARLTWRAAMAGVGLVVIASVGGVAIIRELDRPSSRPGAFAAGEPLHCSGIDQLDPRAAERWLRDRGFQVQWQIEDREAGTSTTRPDAPDRGSIVSAVALSDGSLIIIVDLSRDEPLPPRPCP